MFLGYTLIAVSHEQAIKTLAETVDSKASLDMGSGVATIAFHPVHGDMIIIDNAAGESAVALSLDQSERFTAALLPAQ
ncbi:hypothetical protein AB6809_29855 [Paraburkholderia sp. RCC_158]|uniref:hypothetical protein n=1 Tax=Paraburkholderia sp. RCC_158 TaxID=3239220 RepID=UPI0035269FF2